ncbi:uncharacterized protein T551_01399 [Pneumocystis jirovecii RU7]|uniref:Uncharacterized protein n=1 Tax=Pneumocystis jirovecii (strain RU7) TaxID=1408657 RepID=A0A0W4ZSI6_PNEJ7|nr:uncharacterized protein T551_01399 [Pneumocystis jirovecii RU7]KTW31327.1 hypothetical protein T551_01399 [Pneumocystis jirovecii RU7]
MDVWSTPMERRMLGGRGGSKICGAVSGQGEGHIHGWEHSELGRARRRRRRAGGGCAVQTGSGAASGRQAMAVSRRAGRGGETCCAEVMSAGAFRCWTESGRERKIGFRESVQKRLNGRPAALEANRMSPLEFRGGPLEKGLYRGHVWLPRSARVLMGFGAWALRALPPDTFGRVYAEWMDAYRLSPDTRGTVRGGQKDSTGAQKQAEREASRETNVGCVLAFPDVPVYVQECCFYA